MSFDHSPSAEACTYDAIIVPGGGIQPDSEPRPWVKARLDAAAVLSSRTRYFIVLSRGTTHKPPPQDRRGFAVDESAASAAYLVKHYHITTDRILLDTWSLDTIGNAFYARQMLAAPLALHKLLVVTSAFHMPRTRAIFDWVFGMAGDGFEVDYCVSEDIGMGEEGREARVEKEKESLVKLIEGTMKRVTDLAQLSAFLHVEHGAYNAERAKEVLLAGEGEVEVVLPVAAVDSY